MGNLVDGLFYTDIRPVPETKPRFDPQLGFDNRRKRRVPPPVTAQELRAAKIEKDFRDFCADYFLKYLECQNKNYPFNVRCAPELHRHKQCEFEDYVLRMKEFERERRLLAREQRKMLKDIAARKAAAAATA